MTVNQHEEIYEVAERATRDERWTKHLTFLRSELVAHVKKDSIILVPMLRVNAIKLKDFILVPMLRVNAIKLRDFVGWVERSETHHFTRSVGGFRSALPTLQYNEIKVPDLLNTTAQGEIVLITRSGSPVAIVSPISINQSALEPELASKPKRQRRLGTATGLFTMSEDFDEPLDDFKGYSWTPICHKVFAKTD